VAAAGAIDHDFMIDKLSSGLNSRPVGNRVERQVPKFHSGKDFKLTKDFAQTTVMLAYESIEKKDDRRNPLTILNTVFGGSYSSRLFQEVREKLGLVYSIDSGWMGNADCGLSVVSFATGPQNVDTVLKVVQNEVDKLLQDGITEKELELAKRSIKAEVAMSFETSSSRMSRVSSMVSTHDRVYSIEEQLQRLLDVTLDDVISVARDIFSKPYSICQVGP
jgi:predicted Zn-dependent peptidase